MGTKKILSDDALVIISMLPSGLTNEWQEKIFNMLGRTSVELAAPELLDALIGFFNTKYDLEWLYENKELIINAKNAIKKATE